MNQGIGDYLPDRAHRQFGLVDAVTSFVVSHGGAGVSFHPFHGVGKQIGNRTDEVNQVPGPWPAAPVRELHGGGDSQARRPGLRRVSQRIKPGQGQLPGARGDADVVEDLLVRESGVAARPGPHRGEEPRQQVRVKFRRRTFRDRGPVRVRGVESLGFQQFDLGYLLLTHCVVAIGLPQVGDPTVPCGTLRQGQALDVCHQHEGALEGEGLELASGRRGDGGTGHGGHRPFQASDVPQPHRIETPRLVQAENDRAAVGQVRERAEGVPQRRRPTRSRFHLDSGGVPPAFP